MSLTEGDFRTTRMATRALRQQGRDESFAERSAMIGIVKLEEVITAARKIGENEPVFLEFLDSLVKSWPVAAERAVQAGQGEGAIIMEESQLVDLRVKMRKFVCPALANGTRLSITQESYEVPFLHTLERNEIDAIVSGDFSVYDMARSKHYGARVRNKSIREMMSQTPVSLQHLDPNKFRKIVQGYEDCAPVENKSILPNSGTLAALVASGSPDWNLESMTGEDLVRCGWTEDEVWTSPKSTMLSPVALALTWLHDKTESIANMFYYDAPRNNGGKPSESINRSGVGIKALKDACDTVNLATWLHNGAGDSQAAARKEDTWKNDGEITLVSLKRMIAGLSLMIKHHAHATTMAFTTFYPQTKRDVQGSGSTLGECQPAQEIDRSRPVWPPGVTATMETIDARLSYAQFSHCAGILGQRVTKALEDRYTLPQKVVPDAIRYTHLSDAHLPSPGDTPVLINPGELMRLMQPVDNPSLFAPRHGNRPTDAISGGRASWRTDRSKRDGQGGRWRNNRDTR